MACRQQGVSAFQQKTSLALQQKTSFQLQQQTSLLLQQERCLLSSIATEEMFSVATVAEHPCRVMFRVTPQSQPRTEHDNIILGVAFLCCCFLLLPS